MTKLCSNCGIEETDELQLQKCTGCNSSKILYCSRQCQKSAWKVHKKRCRRKANIADQLIIDNEKISNCDLILNYASKYMKNLKHIEIKFQEKYELVVSHNVLHHLYNVKLFDVEDLSEDTYIQYKERYEMLSKYENGTERYITLKSNKSIWGKKQEAMH